MRKTKSQKYLETAVILARANPIQDLQQFAAIIYRGNRIISVGLNSMKSDPLQKRYGKTNKSISIHAEIAAIKQALRIMSPSDLEGSSIAIARVFKDGSPALAMPCTGCQRALAAFGLRKVVWTDHNHHSE